MASGESDRTVAKRYKLSSQTVVTIHRAKHMSISPARMEPADRKRYEAALQQIAFAAKAHRVSELSRMAQDLKALQESRKARAISRLSQSTDGGLTDISGSAIHPGEETGLLTPDGEFDLYPFRELRSCLEQIAKELGEWDITGAGSRADEASGATNTTVYQVVRGDVQQVIAAGESGQAKPQSIRELEQATAFTRIPLLTQQSRQSVVDEIAGDEGGCGAPANGVEGE